MFKDNLKNIKTSRMRHSVKDTHCILNKQLNPNLINPQNGREDAVWKITNFKKAEHPTKKV